MGPLKVTKKRRKTEMNHDDITGSSEKEGVVDWWDELSKKINGLQKSPPKIYRKTFEYICSLVKDDIATKSAHFSFSNGKPVGLIDQVAVALRRLGSGDSFVVIGESFGLSHSTVSQITWRFVESMEERALHHLQWPSTQEEMNTIKSKFEKIQGFPNCCGAIDVTHITLNLPGTEHSSDVWLDHKKNHSMVLQAIVDPDMKFRDIVTGWPGKMEDSLIFSSSNFNKLCNKGERLDGKVLKFSEESEIREYIIGDSAYPLLPYLIVPYEEKELLKSEAKTQFNKLHLETRMVAQRALTRLKEMWRIIRGNMWRPDKHRLPRIILVCCLLHNIVIDMQDEVKDELLCLYHHNHDSGYQQLVCGDADEKGMALRESLLSYLNGRLHS
ncbi:protein ALP1-like [Trifolium pratense]|uniref:protein ALP1-like n=1 Tax=Trifolium pratense TaxID=57577 RepID=UPI001E697116|nr:protein ALP1-like [Trifolium pratense]